jgi:outer membrane receptor protein involved in Fe transport
MKKIILLIAFLVCNIIIAQRSSNYNNVQKIILQGLVVDKETQQPLEYATISLKTERLPDRTQGGISNENGFFEFEILSGKYDIVIEYIGFSKFTINEKILNKNTNLGKIEIEFAENSLNEIELIGERTEVEIRLDKRIYNVGKDITVRGGSVADVLDNVPSVSVDVEGNVSLRGNDNVRILINGKPSGLVGISGPQGLRSLPAESIEKVEVVTSPSARYDAEGTAGILNIILKRQELIGFNGTFIANSGIPENYGGSANLNWRTNKVNVFTTTSLGKRTSGGNSFNDNEYFNGDAASTFLNEKRDSERQRNRFFTNLGIEYFFNEKTSLTLSGFYRESDNSSENLNQIRQLNKNKATISYSERIEEEEEKDVSFQYSANFVKDYKKDGHRLTSTFQYEESKEDEIAFIKSQTKIPELSDLSFENTINLENQKRILAQSDYVLPIDENTQFELGYRGSFSSQETDYSLDYILDGSSIRDMNLSNILIYKEYINAAYAQYGKKINKFSYLFGLRMEDSKITINQKTTNDNTIKKYTNWFPTTNFSYEFNDKESIVLGYSKRIRRPRSWYINPFPSRSSITNIFQGNPDLDPTFSNTYDLGYLKRWSKITLNGSVYYQKATQVFTFITEDTGTTAFIGGDPNDPDNTGIEVPVIKRSPVNLTENIRKGAEFTLAYFPSKKLRLNGNFNLFKSEIVGSYKGIILDASNLSWFARLNATIKLPGSIDWQTRMFYRGPNENAQTKSKGVFSLNGALNKEILNKKGTISFRASDILNSSKRISETLTPTFYSESEFQWREPSYVLTFTYRINPNNKQNKRTQNYDEGGQDREDFN